MTAQNLNTVEGAPPLPLYKSHKKVRAAKIKEVYTAGPQNGETVISFEDESLEKHIYQKSELANRPEPKAGMYLVQYEDGYVSFSPPEAFESGYTPINENEDDERGEVVADEAFAGKDHVQGEGDLKPHQQRVVDEKTQLTEKLEKLDAFLGGSVYSSLPSDEQSRLSRQHLIMQLYEQVLSERISGFRNPSEAQAQAQAPAPVQ